MTLQQLGWHPLHEAFYSPYAAQGFGVGRVAIQYRDRYVLYTPEGERWGEISGRFRHASQSKEDFPAVGDWVVTESSPGNDLLVIQHVLQRRTSLSRKVVGRDLEQQILAANIDFVFIVMGLDGDYNPRRLERYLSAAWDGGATPIVVLNKADLRTDLPSVLLETESVARGTEIAAVSALRHDGLQVFTDRLRPGLTGVLTGSSGVGKSTIINELLGTSQQRTQRVREDDSRGRHTTTYRELLFLPSGGMLIDSPGLREIQLWGGADMLHDSFDDIADLAAGCRFRDCAHDAEPGCAVRDALATGTLTEERWKSYLKLQRELRFLRKQVDTNAARKEKERAKRISRDAKIITKRKRGG